MKRYHRNWSAFLTLYLVINLIVARAATSAKTAPLAPVIPGESVHLLPPFYRVVQGPVIRAADAEEDRLQTDLPSEPARPLVRDRDAILPDPPNGRILVDRVLAEEMRGQGRAVLARRLYEVCRVARERWQKEVASDE